MPPTSSSRGSRAARPLALALAVLSVAGCGTLSVPDERELGEQIRRQTRRNFTFIRDRVVNSYVREIGREIVDAAGPQPFEIHFDVIVDENVNASAFPGGYIYVHTGLIQNTRNVSELAGVLGHEVGHVFHRHSAQNYNRARTTGLVKDVGVLAALFLSGGRLANVIDFFGTAAGVSYLNTFSREFESEADDFALNLLPGAGYDPRGLVTFFQTIQEMGGAGVPEFLMSHPTPENRIAVAEETLKRHGAPENLKVHDGGKLEIIQHRIRLLLGEE